MNREQYYNEKFSELRKRVGKQEDVAAIIGVTSVQLSRAENGKSASYELLCAIANLTNTDVRELLKPNEKILVLT